MTTISSAPPPSLPSDPPVLAAAAAHQIRSPLASIRLRLELLEDQFLHPAHHLARQEVRGLVGEVERLTHILEQLMTWGTTDRLPTSTETVDPLSAAARRVDAWSAVAGERGVRTSLRGCACTASHLPGTLEQALDVLLDNALHVSPEGSTLHVAVQRAGGTVRTEVIDQGPGMTDEEIAHACRPFWRGATGRNPNGTGLGLAIAATLLSASGGHLELDADPGGGLRAGAVLPAAD